MQMVVKTTTTPVDGDATTTTETLNFTYDASGTPLSVNFSGSDYYYVTNIQGDIMAILNTSGEPVVQYNYDAWGKLYSTIGTLADTLGEVNPLTYRGYVYDHDTELYYLQSRYYNPEVGRFINADSSISTGQGFLGNNMFTYCLNNPANGCDPCGTCFHHWRIWEDCDNCKEENKTEKFVSNVVNTVESAVKNLEFSAGIGQGMYAEFELFDVGIGLGMYGNYGTINYSQGEWSTGQELYSGATASVTPWLEVGAAEHRSYDDMFNEEYSCWTGINDTQETWTIFSAAFYPLFAGGSIYIGFNLNNFLDELDNIWEE